MALKPIQQVLSLKSETRSIAVSITHPKIGFEFVVIESRFMMNGYSEESCEQRVVCDDLKIFMSIRFVNADEGNFPNFGTTLYLIPGAVIEPEHIALEWLRANNQPETLLDDVLDVIAHYPG